MSNSIATPIAPTIPQVLPKLPLTQPAHCRYAGRTTTQTGFRPVRHADIFLPVRFMRAGFTRSIRVPF